jgi:hypothetical protein
VQLGDRRTQGELPGCHTSTLTAAQQGLEQVRVTLLDPSG